VLQAFTVFSPRDVDQTSNWKEFYKETFSGQFWIPEEAEIVSAIQTQGFIEETDRVVFRLPNTKTPAQWVGLIAEKSKLKEYRQTGIWYDASYIIEGGENKHKDTITDIYFIRYWPIDNTYEAVFAWD
jgi:hypothetical protein